MDLIKAFLAKITAKLVAAASDSELAALESEGIDLYDRLHARDDEVSEGVTDRVGTLRQLAAGVQGIQDEAARRIDAAQAEEDEIASIELNRPDPVPDTPEGVEDADQTEEAAAASDAETEPVEAPAETETPDETTAEPVEEPEPVTAAAQRPDLGQLRVVEPAARVTEASAESTPRPLTASAIGAAPAPMAPGSIPTLIGPGGEVVTDAMRADELLVETHRNLGPSRGGLAATIPVLRGRLDFASHEDRVLRPGDEGGNREKIAALTAGALARESWVDDDGSMKPLTAAGQFCAPAEPFYGQPTLGDTARPFRDSLPSMGLLRGSISVSPSPTLGDIVVDNTGGAIDTIEPCETTGVKTIQEVLACPTPVITCLIATSLRLRFDNWNEMTWAERQQAWVSLARVAAARRREQLLLGQVDALSTVVTGATQLGAAADVLDYVDRLIVHERDRLRLADDARFRVVLPRELLRAMAGDVSMQMPGDSHSRYAITEAQVRSWLSERGANLTVVWDRNVPAAQGAGAIQPWAATHRINVFPEGTFMFGGGQELNLGVVRDSANNEDNTFETFEEAFEVAFRVGGWPAYAADLTVCVNGATAGAQDTSTFCS